MRIDELMSLQRLCLVTWGSYNPGMLAQSLYKLASSHVSTDTVEYHSSKTCDAPSREVLESPRPMLLFRACILPRHLLMLLPAALEKFEAQHGASLKAGIPKESVPLA